MPKEISLLGHRSNTQKSKLVMSLIPGSSPVLMPGKRWACRGGRSGAGLLKCGARKKEKSQWRNRSRSRQDGSQALELSSLFADIKTLCTHEHYGGKCCLWRLETTNPGMAKMDHCCVDPWGHVVPLKYRRLGHLDLHPGGDRPHGMQLSSYTGTEQRGTFRRAKVR